MPVIKLRESNQNKLLVFTSAKWTKFWWLVRKIWGRVCFSFPEGHPEMKHTCQHQLKVFCFLLKSYPVSSSQLQKTVRFFFREGQTWNYRRSCERMFPRVSHTLMGESGPSFKGTILSTFCFKSHFCYGCQLEEASWFQSIYGVF